MVATSLPSGAASVIKSRKPGCRRSQGRIARSIRFVNCPSESGFRRTATLRANMFLPPVREWLLAMDQSARHRTIGSEVARENVATLVFVGSDYETPGGWADEIKRVARHQRECGFGRRGEDAPVLGGDDLCPVHLVAEKSRCGLKLDLVVGANVFETAEKGVA